MTPQHQPGHSYNDPTSAGPELSSWHMIRRCCENTAGISNSPTRWGDVGVSSCLQGHSGEAGGHGLLCHGGLLGMRFKKQSRAGHMRGSCLGGAASPMGEAEERAADWRWCVVRGGGTHGGWGPAAQCRSPTHMVGTDCLSRQQPPRVCVA